MERGSGVALWRQIYEALRTEIFEGDIKPGDMLPTEKELSESFDVNRHTVRRAVQALSERGLVVTRQGAGTYVPETVVDYAIKKRTRFSEAVTAQSRVPKSRVMGVDRFKADAHQARMLGVRKGTQLLMVRIIGEADGIPLSLGDHHYVASRFPNIEKLIAGFGSVSKALSEFGIEDYAREKSYVTAHIPSREEAELLKQPVQRPVLLTENINVTPGGEPIEYGRTLFAGDRVQLVFEPNA